MMLCKDKKKRILAVSQEKTRPSEQNLGQSQREDKDKGKVWNKFIKRDLGGSSTNYL
jgi:hypothetical protein